MAVKGHMAVKERIFEAILQIIVELGIEAVTFAEISSRIYMQPSSIAYYFPTKDDMLAEFFSWWLKPPFDGVSWPTGDTPQNAAAQLCALIDYLVLYAPYEDPIARAVVRTFLIGAERNSRFYLLSTQVMQLSFQNLDNLFKNYMYFNIIDCSRYDLALAELFGLLYSRQIMGFFDIRLPRQHEVLVAAAERTKTAILKDGLYPPA